MFSPIEPRLITHQGITRSLSEWAKLIGVRSDYLSYKLDKQNLSVEEALRQAELYALSGGKIYYFKGDERIRSVPRTPATNHKLRFTREYQIWVEIKQKCYNRKHSSFQYVGARGIKVCDRWLHNFEQFYKDIHPRPPGTKILVLIDPTKDYSPENCKWAVHNNWVGGTLWFTYNNESMTITSWAKHLGVSNSHFILLLQRCCTFDKAVEKAKNFLKTAKETGLHRGKKRDISEQRFSSLVAKERIGADKSRNSLWRCECDCGKKDVIVQLGNLFTGHTKSCGCKSKRGRGPRYPKYITYAGVTRSLTQWSIKLALPNTSSLTYRLKRKSFLEIIKEARSKGVGLQAIFG